MLYFRNRLPLWLSSGCWLLLWELAALRLGQEFLLPPPHAVLLRLAALLQTSTFWNAIAGSTGRIMLGFFAATLLGITLALAADRFSWVKLLLSPPLAAISAAPVASFIVLLLLWIPAGQLSAVITGLLVLPVMYHAVENGLAAMDPLLEELAILYRLSPARRLRRLVLPQLLPFFHHAAVVSLGLGWKAGIAAEVIAIAGGSLGELLYEAKIYLASPDLFATTLVIVLLSSLSTRLAVAGLDGLIHWLEGGK